MKLKQPTAERISAVSFTILMLLILFRGTAHASAPVSPTFADRYDYNGCSVYYNTVTAGDVNGDGIPDIVCKGGSALNVLFGNGDGTFRPGPSSPIANSGGGGPTVIDVNSDGKLDVISVGGATNTGPVGFVVSLGNGDGTFQPGTYYAAGTDPLAIYIVSGDFNGDGIIDFAGLTNSGAWVYIGMGGGTFRPGVLYRVSSYLYAGFAVADFNGDGRLDLAVAIQNGNVANGIAVLPGRGDGTFGPEVDTATPFTVFTFVAGDFNSDGHPDIVARPVLSNSGLLYLGKGDGTFHLVRPVTLTAASGDLAAADLNGDGFLDIVTAAGEIVFGNGKGYFSAPLSYPVPTSTANYGVVPAVLRGGGLVDLIFIDLYSQISVLLNTGRGRFQAGKTVPISGGGAFCGVSADFNHDGDPDLAVVVSNGLSILLGTGTVASPYTQGQTIAYSPFSCPVMGDLNGDHIADLLVTTTDGQVVAYLGNGDGTFTAAARPTAISANGTLALGDFNGDGKLDFALTSNLLAYGNGDGTFQAPAPYIPQVLGNNMSGIASARLHGGKFSDIVLTDFIKNIAYVLINNGQGGFTQTTFDPGECAGPMNPVLADLNGDGAKDLLIGCGVASVPIYLNNGAGVFTFNQILEYGAVADSETVVVADVNGDGILDIVVQGNGDIEIFAGQGSMTYTPTVYIGSGGAPGPVIAVNAHGQHPSAGKPDLLTPDASGLINIFFNTTR